MAKREGGIKTTDPSGEKTRRATEREISIEKKNRKKGIDAPRKRKKKAAQKGKQQHAVEVGVLGGEPNLVKQNGPQGLGKPGRGGKDDCVQHATSHHLDQKARGGLSEENGKYLRGRPRGEQAGGSGATGPLKPERA